MTNEDLHQLSDIDLINEKYRNRARIYAANTALKNDVGNPKAQAALHDATERQDAVENHIAHRMARGNVNNPSVGL